MSGIHFAGDWGSQPLQGGRLICEKVELSSGVWPQSRVSRIKWNGWQWSVGGFSDEAAIDLGIQGQVKCPGPLRLKPPGADSMDSSLRLASHFSETFFFFWTLSVWERNSPDSFYSIDETFQPESGDFLRFWEPQKTLLRVAVIDLSL